MKILKPTLLVLTLSVLVDASRMQAQTIPNPSFELDSFSVYPGYVSDNTNITGWTASPADRVGLNPAAGNPFANNGDIPDGTNVAFIQSSNNILSTLSTTITGLTVSNSYRVSFRANCRTNYDIPKSKLSLNGGAFLSFTSGLPVGGVNPYYFRSGIFTATNTTAALVIANQTTNDSTLLVDDFSIVDALLVTTTNDFGPGSLREAVQNALILARTQTVTFASSLSGQTITLTNEIVVAGSMNLTIDSGTNLPGGITIKGGANSNRLFTIAGQQTVSLIGLTLTGGRISNAFYGGGAILNQGALKLTNCTLYGNSVVGGGSAGAIFNDNTLTLARCTLYSNSCSGSVGGGAGAIFNNGFMTMTRCTLSGNSASAQGGGGAIGNHGPLTLIHCTISGNSSGRTGGGIENIGAAIIWSNNIVAGNTTNNIAGLFTGNYNITNGNPLLAPLGNYAGPTMTMALLPGSPALNTAIGSTTTNDQRGFPIVGIPDIGAYEAGTPLNFNAWIWETLPPTDATYAPDADPDGDGASNMDEWLALTDPGNAASVLHATISQSDTNVLVSFPSVLNRNYTLWSADDVTNSFANTGLPALPGDGATHTFTNSAVSPALRFFRIQAAP